MTNRTILGTDRPRQQPNDRAAHPQPSSYFDVAQRDIKLYLTHFLPGPFPPFDGRRSSGRQTTATCLFLMTRLLKGLLPSGPPVRVCPTPSSLVLFVATAGFLSDSRWGAILPRPHLPSIHPPSIYPAVHWWGNRNQGRIQSEVVPPHLTLSLALFRNEVHTTHTAPEGDPG